ncbi:hypothetical protein CHELA40_40037 [Chelatococcus asaccharovorans]|nr:hypothetical protein CHELA17_50156 [Chelatococcus asaccharovorans]CAH1689456.1 hypothetical protein CHELA40_40037 [Chelatococcus asaccharovorans]
MFYICSLSENESIGLVCESFRWSGDATVKQRAGIGRLSLNLRAIGAGRQAAHLEKLNDGQRAAVVHGTSRKDGLPDRC